MRYLLITLLLVGCGQAPGNNDGSPTVSSGTQPTTQLSCKIDGLVPGGSTFEIKYLLNTYPDGTYTTYCESAGNVSNLQCPHATPNVVTYVPPSGGNASLNLTAATNGCTSK